MSVRYAVIKKQLFRLKSRLTGELTKSSQLDVLFNIHALV
ncbi:hypothetical protein EDE11_108187 [Methylomonas methanica]|uniref:Uncharacterized protein n=1 Tax=Methylomonas methanica TaxID=421 RepID=A0ABY2CMZ1_METMH|nr:hypothetical protein EDE11_108187 [Methylomonas methanica]